MSGIETDFQRYFPRHQERGQSTLKLDLKIDTEPSEEQLSRSIGVKLRRGYLPGYNDHSLPKQQ